MRDLKAVLDPASPGTIAIIGLGNIDRSDDGFGIELARRLSGRWPGPVFSEDKKSVEGIVFDIVERKGVDIILFIDAVDFGGSPGDLRLFHHEDAERFLPSFSTHKVPIALLMGVIAQHGKKPYLLGCQPESLAFMGNISTVVSDAMSALKELMLQKVE